MRVQRAQIFGFGKWVDESFMFEDESFICFYGKNEAGKSTLQQFFLYMLFGLPPRKLARFKPKYSNQIGGTLTVHFPKLGEVTIERVESDFRLLLPNGEIEEDEAVLQEQLNDLQEETYRAIYGFSSLDLFQLHQMKQQQLSDLLFSVSLTGSTAVYELERKFARKLDDLFKRAGRRPIINEQITKVNELERNLKRTKQEVLSYRHKINERAQHEATLQELDAQLIRDQERYILNEKIVQFLPQIRTFKRVKAELTSLEQLQLNFPENGIERYEQLNQQLVPITAEYKSIQETINEYEQAMIDKQKRLFIPERYEQMNLLIEKSSVIESDQKKLAELSESMVQLQTQIADYVSRLHITEEDVITFQPPFHAESTWKQLIDEGKSLQHESEGIEEAAEVIEQKRQQLQNEKTELESRFIGFNRLQTLQANEHKRSEQDKQYNSLQTLYNWEKSRHKQSENLSYITSFITVVFFILSFIQKNGSFLAFGFAFLIIALVQLYNFRKSSMKIQSLTDKIQGMNKFVTDGDYSHESLMKQEQLANELTSLKQSLKDIHIEQLQWKEKNNHFALKEQKWINAVELEREKLPLLQQIELDYWIELLHHIEKINDLRMNREQLKTERESVDKKISEFNEAVQKMGQHIAKNKEDLTIRDIQRAIKEHDALKEQINQYNQLNEDANKRLAILNEEQKVIKQQINELFETTDVSDEESFYKKSRQVEEELGLEKIHNELSDQLQAVFSKESLSEIIKQEIDEYSVQREVEQLQTRISEAEAERDELKQKLTTLQVEIEQLESSDDYSYATHLYELELDKLNALADEWAKIKVAQAILEEAKWSYQQKYITDVMTYTANYFNYLTKQRYTTVYPPTETNSFQVEASNKMRYTVEELSKGTIDQLYVALRFAISKVMSEKFVVPLLIDDAFVHFDEERASLAVQLLEDIAEEQQVILYTCQRHVAESVSGLKSLRIDI